MDRQTLTHDDLANDLPLYVLGGLEPAAAEAIASHLAGCPRCRAEAGELRRVVDRLALAPPSVSPPAALRQRLLARLETTTSGDGEAGSQAARSVRRLPGWSYVALAAAVIAILLLGTVSAILYRDLANTRDELADAERLATEQAALLANPARTVPLIAESGTIVDSYGYGDQSYGMLYVAPDHTSALMVVEHLPKADAGRIYQVWLVQGEQRTSAGLFTVGADGRAQLMISAPDVIANYQMIGITEEPGPDGSSNPTGPRVVACRIT